jgi:phenylpropionate dioxygenase-like ring-hydroxylating dioxygenase large terminal subunit
MKLDAFVRDQWYVAAWGEEIDRAPVAREFLGRPVALYRRTDGDLVALEDVCPHRGMPLSMGTVVENDLQCGYHGFRFDPCGQCVHVPSQEEVPARARVRSYAIAERGPLVWLWGGHADSADEASIPDTPELSDPNFHWVTCTVAMGGHYLLMHENVMDQTHFHHLHKNFAGTPEWDRGEITLEVADGRVIRTHTTPASPAPPVAAFAGIEPGTIVDSRSVGTFVQPGLNTSTTTHRVCNTGFTGVLQTFHIITPETETSTRYTIAVGTTDPTADLERFEVGVCTATLEDQQAVEAIQRVKAEPAAGTEVSVKADQPGLRARRIERELRVEEAKRHERATI